jgi:hypothetical protein
MTARWVPRLECKAGRCSSLLWSICSDWLRTLTHARGVVDRMRMDDL